MNALLVSLHVSVFTNHRTDDGITKDVAVLKSLTGDAGRWMKRKLSRRHLEKVKTVVSQARAKHYELTLPWEDGRRILPMGLRGRYENHMNELQGQFVAAVRDFRTVYPQAVEEAKTMHGVTFDSRDYPPEETIESRFTMRTEYAPVPQQNHFSGLFNGQELENMAAQLTAATAVKLEAAESEVWERMLAPVRDLAQRLSDPDAVFRDSLVGHVREILDLAPDFNLGGKPQLREAVEEIKTKLAALEPDLLRTNMTVRRDAITAAAGIIQKFGAVGVRKIS